MKKHTLLMIVALSLAGAPACVFAAMVGQAIQTVNSGAQDYGQEFQLNSLFFVEPAYRLDSLTFFKGAAGYDGLNTGGSGSSSAVFLDIYGLGSSANPNFSDGSDTGGLIYLGSSNNAVDYAAAVGRVFPLGDALDWFFSDITLVTNVRYFAVLSQDDQSGNWVGASLSIGQNVPLGYTNIQASDSDPLFTGTPRTDDAVDNVYTLSVSPVPEPSSALLTLLGLGAVLVHRRRRLS